MSYHWAALFDAFTSEQVDTWREVMAEGVSFRVERKGRVFIAVADRPGGEVAFTTNARDVNPGDLISWVRPVPAASITQPALDRLHAVRAAARTVLAEIDLSTQMRDDALSPASVDRLRAALEAAA